MSTGAWKKHKTIYQFDLTGELINSFCSAKDAANKTGIKYKHVLEAAKKVACLRVGCYFGYKKQFIIPNKKYNFNPLFSKNIINKFRNKSKILQNDSE